MRRVVLPQLWRSLGTTVVGPFEPQQKFTGDLRRQPTLGAANFLVAFMHTEDQLVVSRELQCARAVGAVLVQAVF
jgi:hypothetical protein